MNKMNTARARELALKAWRDIQDRERAHQLVIDEFNKYKAEVRRNIPQYAEAIEAEIDRVIENEQEQQEMYKMASYIMHVGISCKNWWPKNDIQGIR